eukprot:CAMPEP_0176450724 /NCGR_PEP_ID=MMETSP0127-20121128/27332_1 /TAXON_ID=938130 /ORGANISM="Platyophrya macrostoma, Strain WH" /LENGTH=294 /DNA_ID=CAMNT_0017838485 /DNA_START=165 /DNA_END=1049 /DNA_ORIENTATION=+
MELESVGYADTLETLTQIPSKKSDENSSDNYSKDSLKFARRISKSFLQQIKQGTTATVNLQFLECGVEILAHHANLFGLDFINKKNLMIDAFSLIEEVWNLFAKNLNCSFNKKISKVTQDIWEMVFTHKGFWKCLKKLGKSLNCTDYFCSNDNISKDIELQALESVLKKIVFLVARGLILVHMFSLKNKEDNFYQNIAKYENYLVMSMAPDLFDAYNHKRGIFIDECCRCCKVCQAKLSDKNIGYKIKTAWEYASTFAQNFNTKSALLDGFEGVNPFNVLQFLTVLDDAIAAFN